jgi:hypothetical protein
VLSTEKNKNMASTAAVPKRGVRKLTIYHEPYYPAMQSDARGFDRDFRCPGQMPWSDAWSMFCPLLARLFAELRGATFRTSMALNDAKTLATSMARRGGDCSGTAGGAGISPPDDQLRTTR